MEEVRGEGRMEEVRGERMEKIRGRGKDEVSEGGKKGGHCCVAQTKGWHDVLTNIVVRQIQTFHISQRLAGVLSEQLYIVRNVIMAAGFPAAPPPYVQRAASRY